MTDQIATSGSPGIELFPEFKTLYDLIAREVGELSDEQLDFDSNRWEWSKWSIRRQLSHMSSLIYRWLILRWGDTLFPDENHGIEDIQSIANSSYDRRMDEKLYREKVTIMKILKNGIDLILRVLNERSVGFLRSHSVLHDQGAHWGVMLKAHATGITSSTDPAKGIMLLEASIRHIYFEETTHLYNIQRLKRAQKLPPIVNVPKVGYWVQADWDTSEPN